jgi:hypothetical protein
MEVTTRSGRSVQSPYTNEQALEKLQAYVRAGELTGDFPTKLASASHYSDEQLRWVHVIICEYENPKHAKLGDLRAVFDLFEEASQRLEYPKVRLTAGDVHLKLSIAGERSKYRGQIRVMENDPAKTTQEGVPGLEAQRYLGRIDLSGNYLPSHQLLDEVEFSFISDALRQFVQHPAEFAGEQGRATGVCCFCAHLLEDPRSVSVGYGPTCAKNRGLPWGAKEGGE